MCNLDHSPLIQRLFFGRGWLSTIRRKMTANGVRKTMNDRDYGLFRKVVSTIAATRRHRPNKHAKP